MMHNSSSILLLNCSNIYFKAFSRMVLNSRIYSNAVSPYSPSSVLTWSGRTWLQYSPNYRTTLLGELQKLQYQPWLYKSVNVNESMIH